MPYMFRLAATWLLLIILTGNPVAQPRPDALYQAGLAGTVRPLPGPGGQMPHLRNQTVTAHLYPGFCIVKTEYTVYNPDSLAIRYPFLVPDSLRLPLDVIGGIEGRAIPALKILWSDSVLHPVHTAPGYRFDGMIPGRKTAKFAVYQLTRDHQAYMIRDGRSREANAFAYSFSAKGWDSLGIRQLFLKLSDPVSLVNIYGIYPADVSGDLHHLQWVARKGEDSVMLVWYEGAGPDYKFDNKVLPAADTLFASLDPFPLAEFSQPGFSTVNKVNFEVNTRSIFATVIYFLVFSVPWIILAAFIVFLLRKPKKKTEVPQ